jgi:predicted negative regulator of RcsB-dependent stress response
MAGAEDQMSIVVTIIDLLKSGNSTIVLLLVLIALCAYFGWERFQMQKQLNEKILADRQMLLDVCFYFMIY